MKFYVSDITEWLPQDLVSPEIKNPCQIDNPASFFERIFLQLTGDSSCSGDTVQAHGDRLGKTAPHQRGYPATGMTIQKKDTYSAVPIKVFAHVFREAFKVKPGAVVP